MFIHKYILLSNGKKSLSLILITLSILLLPLFIFLLVFYITFSLINLLDFFYTRNLIKGLITLAFMLCSVGFFFLIKYLIKWLRD